MDDHRLPGRGWDNRSQQKAEIIYQLQEVGPGNQWQMSDRNTGGSNSVMHFGLNDIALKLNSSPRQQTLSLMHFIAQISEYIYQENCCPRLQKSFPTFHTQ